MALLLPSAAAAVAVATGVVVTAAPVASGGGGGGFEEASFIELPASPTAALWAAEAPSPSAGKKPARHVSFAREVKAFDGLSRRNEVLDRLIAAYFVQQREISELDVLGLTGPDVRALLELHEDLLDVAARIAEAARDGRQCAPVLPRGGGLCTKLCVPHLPYVRMLDGVVEAAGNRLVKSQQQMMLLQQQATEDDDAKETAPEQTAAPQEQEVEMQLEDEDPQRMMVVA